MRIANDHRRARVVGMLRNCALTIFHWLLLSSVVLAKGAQQPEKVEPPSKDYVLPYALVLLSVGLGLMLVCRPGKRTEEVKRQIEE